MESQPQNPEFRINLENFHPCGFQLICKFLMFYLQEDELKTIKETDESNKPEFQKVFAKITQKSNQANGQVK